MSNEVLIVWSGTASRYRVNIGRSTGGSDVGSVDLATTSYAFVAPRTANTYFVRVVALDGERVSAPSAELTVVTVDLRDVIDAMFFRAGPMSEGRAVQLGTTPAAVWRDGTHLRVLVSHQAGERIRAMAQEAIDACAAVVGGAIRGTAVLADGVDGPASADQLEPFTIIVRIQPRCPLGCANYGPAPLGPNASLVTFAHTDLTQASVTHELGHAYGLAHVLRPNSETAWGFVMNPVPNGGGGLSETEKSAIAAARAGGIRAGTTRDEALALDLVRPYFFGAK